MGFLLQIGIIIAVMVLPALLLKAAYAGADLPGMPKVKHCPRCGAGGEAIDAFQQGNVRRRQVLPIIIAFTGCMIAFGLMIFGFLSIWAARSSESVFYELGRGALLFFPGLYLAIWSIKYLHRRPIVECYSCGWKAGMRFVQPGRT